MAQKFFRATIVITGDIEFSFYPRVGTVGNGSDQRYFDVVLALGEVELAFLGEPTQSAMHLVDFKFSSLAQVLANGLLLDHNACGLYIAVNERCVV